ncbi:hypothetical protein F5144DRAFT_546212 [Chaetomium tenue]|uniref:Uncharacterized protein n=1 Tax=Chaetomium tenue TaxID=1854479 RepID=A0ACB7PA51_9PEZI|nr:hypothetical protein F5144DRAFT_546212 [Chaetomium globosum]
MAPSKTTSFTPPNIADDAAVDYDYDPILHLSRKTLQQIANLLYFASAPPAPPHHTSPSTTTTTTSTTPTTTSPSTIYGPPNPSSSTTPKPHQPILKTTTTATLPPPWLTAQHDAVDALAKADPHGPLLARRHPAVRAVRRLLPLYRRDPWGLCRAHEGLEGEVVGGLLRLVKVEVGVRCDVVLSGVGSLFLDEEDFGRYFGDGVRPECWFEKVESGCPACVLAVVGGRQEVLMALRANLKGRAKNREPRLLGLVEAWMAMFGWHEEREMRAQSDALAEEVNEVRQWMHDRKVRKREERAARGEPEDRRKPPGELPSGTKFIDGVPMPSHRMLGRVRQHRSSRDRGGSPTENKAVDDGVSTPRSHQPADGHQHHDSIIYQAPTTTAGCLSIFTAASFDSAGAYFPPRNDWHNNREGSRVQGSSRTQRQSGDEEGHPSTKTMWAGFYEARGF